MLCQTLALVLGTDSTITGLVTRGDHHIFPLNAYVPSKFTLDHLNDAQWYIYSQIWYLSGGIKYKCSELQQEQLYFTIYSETENISRMLQFLHVCREFFVVLTCCCHFDALNDWHNKSLFSPRSCKCKFVYYFFN